MDPDLFLSCTALHGCLLFASRCCTAVVIITCIYQDPVVFVTCLHAIIVDATETKMENRFFLRQKMFNGLAETQPAGCFAVHAYGYI